MVAKRTPAHSPTKLRLALGTGALLWLFLLGVGFVAPDGWVWGMAGPIGHIENVMISLWLVTLVLVPVLAWPDPIGRTAQIQAYLLCRSSCYRDTMRKKR